MSTRRCAPAVAVVAAIVALGLPPTGRAQVEPDKPSPLPYPAPKPLPPEPRDTPLPLRKGPVLQHPTPDAITILWETDTPAVGVVRVTPVSGQGPVRTGRESGARLLHRVTVSGLKPATRYRYAVLDHPRGQHTGVFRTAVTGDQPFAFLVYGDCRSQPTRHLATVEAMLGESADFVFNTGDLVKDGAKERLWQRFFRIGRRLFRKLPLYPVLGNHELSSSWRKGVAAFRRYFALPQNGPEKGVTYSFVHGNSLFIVLNSNASFVGTEQTRWAVAGMRRAASRRLRHIFVFLHHGPLASGIHGENFDVHISGLVRQLAEHGVDAVFSGHDHIYERGEKDGLRYVVSGGCGAPLYPRRRLHDYTAMFESTNHFVRVLVQGDAVELTALRPDGSRIDNLKYVKHFDPRTLKPRFQILKDSHPRRPRPGRPRPAARPPAQPETVSWSVILAIASLVAAGLVFLLLGYRIGRA